MAKEPRSRSTGKGGRQRALSDAETELWERAMSGTHRLSGKTEPGPETVAGTQTSEETAAPRKPPPARLRRTAKPALSPALGAGELPGIDRRTAERFKRGQIAIEARIDLHGHTRETAQRALRAFLEGAQNAGRRCVLVITGRGARVREDDWGRAEVDAGVLYEEVPRWLNTPDLRRLVLGFARARPKHGGEGALYVLIRRRK